MYKHILLASLVLGMASASGYTKNWALVSENLFTLDVQYNLDFLYYTKYTTSQYLDSGSSKYFSQCKYQLNARGITKFKIVVTALDFFYYTIMPQFYFFEASPLVATMNMYRPDEDNFKVWLWDFNNWDFNLKMGYAYQLFFFNTKLRENWSTFSVSLWDAIDGASDYYPAWSTWAADSDSELVWTDTEWAYDVCSGIQDLWSGTSNICGSQKGNYFNWWARSLYSF
jgi:hypothetical protein